MPSIGRAVPDELSFKLDDAVPDKPCLHGAEPNEPDTDQLPALQAEYYPVTYLDVTVQPHGIGQLDRTLERGSGIQLAYALPEQHSGTPV